jgi:hypothetical protein
MNPLVTTYRRLPPSAVSSLFKHEAAECRPSAEEAREEVGTPIYVVTEDMSQVDTSSKAHGGSWLDWLVRWFIPNTITSRLCMQNREDGLHSIAHAPMGVHGTTTWLVKVTEDGKGLLLEERGIITGNRMLMGFIKPTLQQSHETLVRRFVAALEKEVPVTRIQVE